jgi:outer membrane receptor protein involved in Fe transport
MNLYKTGLLACVGLSAIAATPAFAQAEQSAEEQGGIEDIVVTAQRRAEKAQATPLAITAIGGDALQASGVFETADLSAVVPNMQIISPYGRAQPNISLRGISVANEYNANQASPIGVYVDDAYMASRTSHGMQLYDLERVEVLRGPQGTLYGRNTTGGAVNFITMRPKLDGTHGFAEIGFGKYNRVEASGAIDLTLVPDKLGIRVAGNYIKSDGMVNNLVPGTPDLQSEDSIGVRVSLLAKPSDDFTIFAKFYHGKDKPMQVGNHFIGATPNGTSPLTGYGRSASLGFFEVEANDPGKFEFDGTGGLLNLSYNSGDFTLISNTSYDSGGRKLKHDADNSPSDILQIYWNDHFKQFNQEVRVNYDADGVKAILGGYYGWDRVDVYNQFQFLFFLKGIVPFALPFPAATSGFGIDSRYRQTRESKAVFGQVEYELTDKLTASLGLRYTWDKLDYSRGNANVIDYNLTPVFNTIPAPGPYDPAALLSRSNDYKAFTGRFGLDYKVANDVLVYASYSRGYRAGAINGGGYLSPTQIDFVPPEEVNAYEVGLKSDLLDRRLRLNLAGFYYDYKNQQLQEVIGAVALLRSAPKAKIFGAELEMTALLTDNFKINSTVGLLNTKYEGLTLSGINLDGNRLPFAPKITWSGGAEWTAARTGMGNIVANANFSYTSQQWFSPFNEKPSFVGDPITNINQQQKAYVLVNGQLRLDGDRFYGSLWAKNIFNKGYHVYGLDLRAAFAYDYLALGAPRTFGATVGVKF